LLNSVLITSFYFSKSENERRQNKTQSKMFSP